MACLFAPLIARVGLDHDALIGLGLALTGTMLFCMGNITSIFVQRRRVPMLSANAWGMIYGVIVLGLVCVLHGRPLIIEPTLRYTGALSFLVVFSTVIASATYMTLLRRIGAARAGYATVLFPIVALTASTAGRRWPSSGSALPCWATCSCCGPRSARPEWARYSAASTSPTMRSDPRL